MNKLGRFGGMVKQYEQARRGYPVEVFRFLKIVSPVKAPSILDLGCGTGISTRQLAPLGKVIGCDPDPVMLRAAKKHPRINREKYTLSGAAKLPFNTATFDVITAFGAFHWFDDTKSTQEIKRVLKPGGIFFVVNKNGIKTWGEGYRHAIIKTIKRQIASFQKNQFHPIKALRSNGFHKIQTIAWKKSEVYSLRAAMIYVQSVSIWNSVPKELHPEALKGLREYFKHIKRSKGKIERKLEVNVVFGKK